MALAIVIYQQQRASARAPVHCHADQKDADKPKTKWFTKNSSDAMRLDAFKNMLLQRKVKYCSHDEYIKINKNANQNIWNRFKRSNNHMRTKTLQKLSGKRMSQHNDSPRRVIQSISEFHCTQPGSAIHFNYWLFKKFNLVSKGFSSELLASSKVIPLFLSCFRWDRIQLYTFKRLERFR